MSQRQREATPSRTETVTEEATQEGLARLVLRGNPSRRLPRVRWTEDVIDNEHLNRKKTKICCIYHPPDDELEEVSESEDSDSDSDSDSDAEGANGHHCARHNRPNAYERQPRIRRPPPGPEQPNGDLGR